MNKLSSLAFLVGLVSVVACNVETADQAPALPERAASEEGANPGEPQPGAQQPGIG
jgi:hypothetical protein